MLRTHARRALAAAGLLVSFCGPLLGQSQADTIDVLFVGNSYIYYNNLPALVEGISLAMDGPVLRTAAHTHGGRTLQGHIEDGHVPPLLENGPPVGGHWDWVVLQEQSTLGTAYDRDRGLLGSPEAFHSATRALVSKVREVGARPALYMTWAKERFPEQADVLSDAYNAIGRELSVDVAKVGEAWALVRQRRPEFALHVADGSHPNPAGSYLAACVFYALFTGRSPVGAPPELSGAPWEGSGPTSTSETEVLVQLTGADATFLQTVAAEVAGVAEPHG